MQKLTLLELLVIIAIVLIGVSIVETVYSASQRKSEFRVEENNMWSFTLPEEAGKAGQVIAEVGGIFKWVDAPEGFLDGLAKRAETEPPHSARFHLPEDE